MPSEDALATLKRGTVEVLTEEDLKKKLAKGKTLRVKLGVDPTSPDIHLGHTVVLRKMRQFQDLGHQAVLIIGDFTARIGDPSGKKATRPRLTGEEIEANAKTYLDQIGKVVDVPKLELVRNGDWLGKLGFDQIVELAAKFTVARILEREDFTKRYKEGTPIGLHEFLYPLMQAYDSVVVRADVELGGTDQTFNLLAGRQLQMAMGQEAQVALTVPILKGLDGENKMSKSLGNHIGVADAANDMFGKTMSIPDALLTEWYTLLTTVPLAEVQERLKDPRNAKAALGEEIVRQYHGEAGSRAAREHFEKLFTRKEVPEDVPDLQIPRGQLKEGKIWIVALIKLAGAVPSTSEGRRLVEQGGVTLDGEKVTDPTAEIAPRDGALLKVGKKNKYWRLRVV